MSGSDWACDETAKLLYLAWCGAPTLPDALYHAAALADRLEELGEGERVAMWRGYIAAMASAPAEVA